MQTTIDFIPRFSWPLIAALLAAVMVSFVVIRLVAGRAIPLARRTRLLATRGILLMLLVALLANPVRVAETPGAIQPADVIFLLDASESMALGDQGASRWDHAVDMICRSIDQIAGSTQANLSFYRFGRRLQAMANFSQERASRQLPGDGTDAPAGGATDTSDMEPDEADTQLLMALRQLPSRFGRRPPAGVVVFSDGRARNAEAAEEVAGHFARVGVPIHVVPLGDSNSGGDVSVVSLVAPAAVRKHSHVNVHAFVRSYGYSGQRAEIELLSLDAEGNISKKLDSMPILLTDGIQTADLSFRSDESIRRLRVRVQHHPNEVTTENNHFDSDVRVDRTTIRVLYVEGHSPRSATLQADALLLGRATYPLPQALEEDLDIDCRIVPISSARLTSVGGLPGFPRTAVEFSSYDAIILSNAPSSVLTEDQMTLLKEWIQTRGGGFCMAGGPNSFNEGGWGSTLLATILPVQISEQAHWQSGREVAIRPDIRDPLHPIFRLLEDRRQNRELLLASPAVRGVHLGLVAKPNVASVLSLGLAAGTRPSPDSSDDKMFRVVQEGSVLPGDGTEFAIPAITSGTYGRGRTLALAFPIAGSEAEPFTNWGEAGNSYHNRFWRNMIYWLTESSYIGRRRLVASVDKRFYQPGQSVTLTATAYDEAAQPTTDYRLVAMIEPQASDVSTDYAPIRWPSGIERTSGEEGPLLMWGEEFEIPVQQTRDGQSFYELGMQLAEAPAIVPSSGGMRIEIASYEGHAQIDSTSLPIQLLNDPFERQNPFPNHELLEQIAAASGGKVLSTPTQLAEVIRDVPIATSPAQVQTSPAWNNWWLLIGLMSVLTLDWCLRRRLGLA